MRIKICCISSIEEIKKAITAGADTLGFVGPMPSGPGILSIDAIRSLLRHVPSQINTFFLSAEQKAARIIEQCSQIKTTHIQLVDSLPEKEYKILRASLPDLRIVQVIHVQDDTSIQEAKRASLVADMLLLDSGNPQAMIKELGGTGRVHNWNISAQIVQSVSVPVFLAGGLHSRNISEAIRAVRPFGVDVCSGVRSNGHIDQKKLAQFIAEIRQKNGRALV